MGRDAMEWASEVIARRKTAGGGRRVSVRRGKEVGWAVANAVEERQARSSQWWVGIPGEGNRGRWDCVLWQDWAAKSSEEGDSDGAPGIRSHAEVWGGPSCWEAAWRAARFLARRQRFSYNAIIFGT